MKNCVFLGLLFVCCALCSIAQPTYTAASNPVIGQQWEVVVLDTVGFRPGSAAANANWDFTNLNPDPGFPPFQFSILDPAQAPFTDSFPGATHVVKWELVGFPFHQFEIADNQQRSVIGGVVPEDTSFFSMSQYLDDDDALQYPLSYQKSYTFTSLERVRTFGFAFRYAVEGNVEVDAYGTLKLPNGTFSDVIRVRIERARVDSLFFPPQRDTSVQYIWLQEGNAMPLMVYEYSLTDPDEEASLYYASSSMSNGIFDAKQADFQVSLYPQPVLEKAYLQIEPPKFQKMLAINLLDFQGKTIRSLFHGIINNNSIELYFHSIPPGLYFIQMRDELGQVVTQKMIKK